jgi:diacylglycerol kinase family enzyme
MTVTYEDVAAAADNVAAAADNVIRAQENRKRHPGVSAYAVAYTATLARYKKLNAEYVALLEIVAKTES